jgi:hypothetical protein
LTSSMIYHDSSRTCFYGNTVLACSNNIGSDLNSRQTFTGSINISGSMKLVGSVTGPLYINTTGSGTNAQLDIVHTSCQEGLAIRNISGTSGYSPIAVRDLNGDIFQLNQCGRLYISGSVGIGTSTPCTTLHLSTINGIRLQYPGNTGYIQFSTNATNDYIFSGFDGEKVRITSGGSLSINQTSAYSVFNLTGTDCGWGEGIVMNPAPNGYSAIHFRLEGRTGSCSTCTWQLGKETSTSGVGELLSINKQGLTGGKGYRADASQQWKTNGDSVFGFNVGIGTCTPVRKLDIVTTSEQLRLAYDASGTTYTDFRNDSAGGLLINTSAAYIINYIGGSERLRISNNCSVVIRGSLGICNGGAINFTIPNGLNGGTIRMDCFTSANAGDMYFTGGSGEGFLLSGTGRIGVGTISPSHKVHINSTDDNAYALRVQGNTNNEANVWTGIGIAGEGANTKTAILFQDIGQSYSRGRLLFAVNNAADQTNATPSDTKMMITNDGIVYTLGAGVDGTYCPMIGGMYSANNNETNLISTAVSSNGTQSGFRFDVSNGAGSTGRTTSMTINRGSVSVVGSLSKGSGSFRIKHPLAYKKCTHQLVHSFIEGPNADLIYSGHTKLIDGVSCINIDCISRMTEGTFEALNRCVRIFTTNETSWSAVRGKVCGNMVVIESQDNTSEDEISWMVIGERQDQHMFDTEWTDSEGRVITEPEIEPQAQ